MKFPAEPILYPFVRVVIKLQNAVYTRLCGSGPVKWVLPEIKMKCRTEKKYYLIQWIVEQVIGDVLSGIAFPIWCLFAVESASVLNNCIFLTLLFSGISSTGLAHKLFMSSGDTVQGVNALLDHHRQLREDYKKEWVAQEKRWRSKLLILGLGTINATVVAILAIGVAFIGVFFHLDPLYFIFSEIFVGDGIGIHLSAGLVAIRVLALVLYIISVCGNMCFMFPYCILTFYTYLSTFVLLTTFDTPSQAIFEYQKLAIIDTRIAPFADSATAWLMFLGHTCCIAMYWLSIRGWGMAPAIVISFYPFSGTLVFIWLMLILTILSSIFLASESVLETLNQKLIVLPSRRDRMVLKRQILGLQPICFKCGNWFVITRDSPGSFLMTVLDNLTSAVLTY